MVRVHVSILSVLIGTGGSSSTCQADTTAEETSLLQGHHSVRRHKAKEPTANHFLEELGLWQHSSPWSFAGPALPPVTEPDDTTSSDSPNTHSTMQKVMLPENLYGGIGGRCMDGGMSGYYYGRGTSNLWIIFMEGGGGCHDKEGCDVWNLYRGSRFPENWSELKSGTNLLARSNREIGNDDTDFHNAHRVYIPYCTGDLHLGQVVTPLNGCEDDDPDTCCDTVDEGCVNQWGYYFSGHLNFKNILHHIFSNQPDSRNMEKILFTGNSAGGLGVIHQCDWLHQVTGVLKRTGLVNNVEEVTCAPVGGWNHPDDELYPSAEYPTGEDAERPQKVTAVINSQRRFMPPNCYNALPEAEGWKCISVAAVYPHITPRMFIAQNKYDNIFIGKTGLKPCPPSSDPVELQQQEQFIAAYGQATQTSLQEEIKLNDGLFLASCLDHLNGINFKGGEDRSLVQGISSLEAFTNWYLEGHNVQLIDDCIPQDGLPCNPTCVSNACELR